MKNKRISKILGWGLSSGLIFASVAAIFVSPAVADEVEWGKVNTPSWADHVIEPGSDIYGYDIDGDDGDFIVAVGAVNGSDDDDGGSFQGLTGSFYTDPGDGSVTVTKVTDTSYTFSGTAEGNACYLSGDFTAVLNVEVAGLFGFGFTGNDAWAVITGTTTATTMTFSGMLYIDPGDAPLVDAFHENSPYTFGDDWFCVDNWQVSSPSAWGDFVINYGQFTEPRVWTSDDGGVTWSDITADVQDSANLPGPFIQFGYGGVAIAPDDPDWLVISGGIFDPALIGIADAGGAGLPLSGALVGVPATVASKDGTSDFSFAGDMVDPDNGTRMALIYDVDVSIETDSNIHIIAVAGLNNNDNLATWGNSDGAVFRLDAGTWLTGTWEDTTFYPGWDEFVGNAPTWGVVDGEFSTNFDLDDTYVCIGADNDDIPYVQMALFESGTWNGEGGFPDAVEINSDGETLLSEPALRSMGLALPADYDGSDPGARSIFLYVDAFNTVTGLVGGFVFRLDNDALTVTCGPSGDPLLASIAIHGDADTGKLMIGKYMDWDNDGSGPGEAVEFDNCAGVSVWHTEELDFCCPQWDAACKDPSGPYGAQVMYTPDGDKAYASTTGLLDLEYVDPWTYGGGLSDESAFSVSLDDGVSFNQLGLIDTDIDYLSDVAICPDCSVIYISTINVMERWGDCCGVRGEGGEVWQVGDCDSVWRSYDDGDTWERIYHGEWDGELLLRLPCDDLEDCCTVYLGIQGTDELYYSRDCGQCWNSPPATKIEIQDFVVASENVVYILDDDGMVSMSTQYGRRWSDAEDTGLDSGHSITSCCDQGDGFVVVGGDGGDPVAWSDDGGDSWNTTDDLPSAGSGEVHVACDPTCVGTIYAAVDGDGIYRTTTDSGAWDDLNAMAYAYSGIVVAREGTLYASTDEISVDVDVTPGEYCLDRKIVGAGAAGADYVYSGVARNLTPCETACCGTEDWDYLFNGLSDAGEFFDAQPTALRICGCLSADSNSILWAIDYDGYNVTDASDGALWSYEDCAAKTGITLTAPADNTVLDCEPCAGCDAASFTLKWERMCNACSYDIQIMDEDGNLIVEWVDEDITGDPPALYIDGLIDHTEYFLECGNTYTWQVREANTASECVHSPWSETWTFTIAVGAADALKLLAPDSGAMGVPINSVAFSWSSVINADSYSFVLAPNANLTGALVSMDMGDTAYNFVGPLEFGKAYYWKVVAWKDGTILTTSNVGAFNTEAAPVPSTPPVVVETTPAPVITIPPTQMITPTWIYAIIGIGAALAVVVIVLIVRTRRP